MSPKLTIEERIVPIDQIHQEVELMMRVELNQTKISEYRSAMKAGAAFPPIECVEVDGVLLLANGFHRTAAKKRLGETTIIARVRLAGTYQDAQDAAVESVRANSYGGLKHTSADKRKAVSMALQMERHQDKSDRVIADLCGVHHELVGTMRNRSAVGGNRQLTPEKRAPTKVTGKDGKRYPTTKRKRKREPFKYDPPPAVTFANAPKTREEVFAGMTPEEIAKVPYRHIHLQPMKQELIEKRQMAARTFSSAVREFGMAAQAFLKTEKMFEPEEYIETLATMENSGRVALKRLTQNFESLIAALKIIEAFNIDVITKRLEANGKAEWVATANP